MPKSLCCNASLWKPDFWIDRCICSKCKQCCDIVENGQIFRMLHTKDKKYCECNKPLTFKTPYPNFIDNTNCGICDKPIRRVINAL